MSVYVGVVHRCYFQQWSFKILLPKQAYNKTLMSMMDFHIVRSIMLCHFFNNFLLMLYIMTHF